MKYINKLTDLFIKLSLPNVKAKHKRRGIKWTKKIEQKQILRFPPCSMYCIEFNIDSWSKLSIGVEKFLIYPD